MPQTSSEITLRVVRPEDTDLDAVVALVNRAFRVHPPMEGRDRTDVEGLLEEAGGDGRFILAESGGQLVGTAMIRPVNETDPVPGYAPPETAFYFGLAGVDTSLMRSGVGRRLLAEAERIGRAEGHTHLALTTLYEFDLVPYYKAAGCTAVFDEPWEAGHWGLGIPHTICHFEKAL